MFSLVPTNTKFFDQFNRAADVIVKAADCFIQYLDHPDQRLHYIAAIKTLEHEADEIAHETMNLLHKSFITPLDRGDTRRLTFTLDNVIDLINDAARGIGLYELAEIWPEARILAVILLDATRAIQKSVSDLPHLRSKNNILQYCIEINRLENEGDHQMHLFVASLFKSGMDPLTIIKWKEITELIENAIDQCEDVANVLEGIVQENA